MRYNGRLIYAEHPMVTVAIDERGGLTYAKAEMVWGSARLTGLGIAYRHPSDSLTRETGEGLATARALAHLEQQVAERGIVKA